MKSLLQKIEAKNKELEDLKEQLSAQKKDVYQFLVGRYFSLACTCKIKITGILDADSRYLIVDCIRIQGKNNDGNLEITMDDDYSLSYDDVDRCMNEITEQQFFTFLNNAIKETLCIIAKNKTNKNKTAVVE